MVVGNGGSKAGSYGGGGGRLSDAVGEFELLRVTLNEGEIIGRGGKGVIVPPHEGYGVFPVADGGQ